MVTDALRRPVPLIDNVPGKDPFMRAGKDNDLIECRTSI